MRVGAAGSPDGSRGRARQHLFPLPGVAEELQLPGEQLHLHWHRLVLLAVDAERAPGSLRTRGDGSSFLSGHLP